MKRKLTKIFGIGLTLVMVLSLMMFFAPVAAAADYEENEWGTWGMPSIESDTDVGPMAVAPDGTLFAAVLNQDGLVWVVQKSEDNGYTWDDTELELEFVSGTPTDPEWPGDVNWTELEENAIVEIAIGKNYDDDEILYVATYVGTVYRLEEAGDGDVTALKDYPESVSALYSIDTWYDGDDNWIMAGTDIDVFVLRDAVFEDWGPQELNNDAYEVAFAPDFDDSELIWVITDDDENPSSWGDYMITSTESPGQWGLEIGQVVVEDGDGYQIDAWPWVDLGFPDNYDSDPDSGDTILFAALSSDGDDAGDSGEGGVYLIEGVADNGDSNAIELFDLAGEAFAGTNIVSLAVSGDYPDCVILAAALSHPTVYISDDGGEDWGEADKNPTGWYDFDPGFTVDVPYDPVVDDYVFSWTHVYMEADVVWGGDVFDVEESMSFVSTFGEESAVSRSDPNEDGELVYNQVGNIDTYIDDIDDIAFHPDFPDTPTFLMTTDNRTGTYTDSVWLTENGDSDEPDYIRVLCGSDQDFDGPAPGNFLAEKIRAVEFAQDADAIYITGRDDGWDHSIWKSTDDGQTFGSERTVQVGGTQARIIDWVITDSKTIYAAVDNSPEGFYMTTNSGLSWSDVDTDGPMNDIAMQPGFDADDEDMDWIALGGMYDEATGGEVWLSNDAGDAFDNTGTTGLVIYNTYDGSDVFVAFDADFADEDADGYMLIYAADDQGSEIVVGEVTDPDDVTWDPLEDDENSDTQGIFATGLQVSEDNALYAIGELTEAVTVVVVVNGTVDLLGESSGWTETFLLVDVEVDVDSGTFEDGEVADVIGAALTAESSTVVSGTIYIEGDDSEAIGSIDVTFVESTAEWTAFPPFFEDVFVDGWDLDISVEEVAVDVGLARLLLHEDNSEWESQADDDLVDPAGLWLSLGSNVLWTIDADDAEVWVLEDTLSGSPTLESPPDGYQSDYEDEMQISWEEMRGIDEDYQYKYYHLPTGTSEKDLTDDTSVLLTELRTSSEYEWKVRAAPQSTGNDTWSSRWSGKWSFHTALGEPPWAPTLYTPGGIWQYSGIAVELMPAFSWESAKSADGYQFVLADNAELTSPLVNEKVPESAYQLDFELEYNSNYFWRVMAYKGNDAISRWSDIGAFTTIEKAVPALTPAPPVTVTPAPPAPIVIPTPIPPVLLWVIVGIGAALIIAVIILIIRTRRVV